MLVSTELADPALEGYIFRDEDSPAEEDEVARGYTAVKAHEKVRQPAGTLTVRVVYVYLSTSSW